MFEYLIGALFMLLVPFFFFRFWQKIGSETSASQATISNISLLGKDRYGDGSYDYLSAMLPNNEVMEVYVTSARKAALKDIVVQTTVTITRPRFGAPYISAVLWPGEIKVEAAEPSNNFMYLGVIYFILSLFTTIYAFEPAVVAAVGQLGMDFAGLLMILSGFIIAKSSVKPITANAEIYLLGLIRLGSGHASLVVTAALNTVLTLACFWYGGMCTFLGLFFGFSMGMMLSMLTKPMEARTKLVNG